jgi:hypothetical protein
MRTKTLLLTAALGAAGVASAVAQVYSVNAVGYVNTALATGFNLVANPLNTAGNTIAEVHPTAPDGTLLYTYSPTSGYTVATWDGEWITGASTVIAPGTGYFLRVAAAATVTYVGEVPQGALTINLVAGYNLVGSKVPQAGGITTALGFTPADGDQVYTFDAAAGYKSFTYDGEWLPSEPLLKVGEGVWIRKVAAGTWTRNFSVN